MNKTAYHAYLRSPQWQAKRQRMLAKAKNRCQVCNGTEQLQVHHRTYKNIGSEYLADLVVLCRNCHALFHGKLPIPKTTIRIGEKRPRGKTLKKRKKFGR